MGKRTENVGFSVCKTLVNVSKMPRFPSIQPSFSRTVNASFFAVQVRISDAVSPAKMFLCKHSPLPVSQNLPFPI